MSEETARELTGADHARMFGPPSPGQQTIEDLRELIAEIQGTDDTGDAAEWADDAARLAGQLLADLDKLVASLPRGEWGSDELGTLANWLGEHGYDIGDEDGVWAICHDGGVSDQFATKEEAEAALAAGGYPAGGTVEYQADDIACGQADEN